MERSEILKGLTESRDPGIEICQKFLAARDLGLNDEAHATQARCRSEADAGSSEAQFVLATLLWTGLLGITDRETAVTWCNRAANSGYAPAQTMLSGIYQSGGPGVSKDLDRAIALLEQAAGSKYVPALSYLGIAYLHGLGVPENHGRGLALLNDAAEGGDVFAQSTLGSKLIESGDSALVRVGMQWLHAAADQGLASAHRSLAELFATGAPGVSADKQRAERHRVAASALEGME